MGAAGMLAETLGEVDTCLQHMLGSLQVIQRKILQLQPCSQDCIGWAYNSLTHPHDEVAPGNYTALPWHSTVWFV